MPTNRNFFENDTGVIVDLNLPDGYAIRQTADYSFFNIDGSGRLTFKSSPDYENPLDSNRDNTYTVHVLYDDGDRFEVVNVTIKNRNEAPTEIKLGGNSNGTITIPEEQAGYVIGSLSATAPENGAITYSLAGTDKAFFEIATLGDGTKQVKLLNSVTPNFESNKKSYDLTVVASSGGETTEKTFTIKIDDVNEKPTSLTAKGGSVIENKTSETNFGKVTLEDPDTKSEFETYSYTFSDDRFTINQAGELVLKENNPLDKEKESSIELKITATDVNNSENKISTEVTITVDDEPEAPTDITLGGDSSGAITIPEEQAGYVIGSLSATPPAGGDIEFTLADFGDGSSFQIVDGPGGVKEVKLLDTVKPNFESGKTSYDLKVIASSGGETTEKTFTIKIDDVNEKPTSLTATGGSVIENKTGETNFGKVTLEDPDTKGEFETYSYTFSDDRFMINQDGELVLKAGNPLDKEKESSIELAITATDVNESENSISTKVIITVDDVNEPPVLVPRNGTMNEDTTQTFVVLDEQDKDPEGAPLWLVDVSSDVGSVIIAPGGKGVVFSPPANFFGTVKITYTVSDLPQPVNEGGEGGEGGEFVGLTTKGTLTVTVLDVAEPPVDENPNTPTPGPGAPTGPNTPPPGPDTPTPTPNGFDGSIPALVISSFVEGAIPGTQARLESLSNFAEFQFLSYQERGVARPELGPYEALGRGFAETTDFQDKYGALTEAAFILEAYEDVFGRQATAEQADHFQAQIDYFEALYASVDIPEDKAEMLAKGAALGQMLGVAVLDETDTQPYFAQAQAFLEDAADGVVEMGKPLAFYELN